MNLQPIVYKTIALTNCASPPLRSLNFTIKRASITAIKYEELFVPTEVPMWLYTAEAAVGYIVLEYQRCAALFHRLLWLITGHHCTREGPFSRSFSRLAAHLLNTTYTIPYRAFMCAPPCQCTLRLTTPTSTAEFLPQ